MADSEVEQFSLKWNNFEKSVLSGCADLLENEAMVDVTLAVEGKAIQAHKLILSVCSAYFRKLFQLNPSKHPIVLLPTVEYHVLVDMLDFMYKGEANVTQIDLPNFLKLAQFLEVKGLAGESSQNLCNNFQPNTFKIYSDNGKKSENLQAPRTSPIIVLPAAVDDDVDSDFVPSPSKKRKRTISPSRKSVKMKSMIKESNAQDKLETDLTEDMDVKEVTKVQSEDIGINFLDDTEPTDIDNSNEEDVDAGSSKLDADSEQVQENVSPGEWKEITSARGNKLLVVNGFVFRMKSTTVISSFWLCVQANCHASLKKLNDGSIVLLNRKHNHKSNPEEVAEREKVAENAEINILVKKYALETNMSPDEITNNLNIDAKKVNKFHRKINQLRENKTEKKTFQPTLASEPRIEVIDNLNYKFIHSLTSKNKLLHHQGYVYRQDFVRTSKKDKQSFCYYRCHVKKCPGRVKTDDSGWLTVMNMNHSHEQEKDLEKKETLALLKEQLIMSKKPINEFLKENHIEDKTIKKSLKQYLKRTKAKTNEISPPNPPPEISIPENMLNLSDSFCDSLNVLDLLSFNTGNLNLRPEQLDYGDLLLPSVNTFNLDEVGEM